MNEKTFRVRIARAGQEFEVEGDRKFVLEMLERFEPGAASPPSPRAPSRGSAAKGPASKDLSAREFIQRLGLKKHTDIGLAFGYYIEKYLGKDGFTPADINSCYYEAKMEPSNTSQVIILNTKSGRMMPAKKAKGAKSMRKTYILTTTGEEFISKKLEAAPK
jgi:hypothetical protein